MKFNIFSLKFAAFVSAAFLCVFASASCTAFFDLGEESISDYGGGKEPEPNVVFVNNDIHGITVYTNRYRNSDDFWDIPGNKVEKNYYVFPSTYTFYRNYDFVVFGKTIEWEYPGESLYVIKRQNTLDRTRIVFAALTESDTADIEDVYVVLENKTGSSISLQRGVTVQARLDEDYNTINNNDTGLFKVEPGQTTVYGVEGDAIIVTGLTFARGYVYKITVEKSGTDLSFSCPNDSSGRKYIWE